MSRIVSAVGAAIFLLISGCSFSASVGDKPSVEPAELEKQVADKSDSQGFTTDEVDCPEPLEAEVGAGVGCTVMAKGLKYKATVRATKVEDDVVSFDLRIPLPAIVPTDGLESQARELLGSQVDGGIDTVECPDELTGEEGESVDCEITSGTGETITVGATVTKATFDRVDFSFRQK